MTWILLFKICTMQECHWVADSPLNQFPTVFQCNEAGAGRMQHTIMYFDFRCDPGKPLSDES